MSSVWSNSKSKNFLEDTNVSGFDDDEEVVTAAEVYRELEQTWMNEKLAPELLPPKSEVVECMMEQVKVMEENINSVKKGDFVASLHQLEVERIRYLLASYLRTRLKKIEQYVFSLLEEEDRRSDEQPCRLSSEELTYAKEYCNNVESHMSSLVLQHMPANLQSLNREKVAVRPNMDSYVFLKVRRRCEGVLVDDEDEEAADLEEGSQHLMRYKPIAMLIANDSISLI
ncbi:DNA replication complex GINS protein SLD5-like [Corticium candelabrum]|uniref:DNA replication complex GINS protein SLD5-like n=1 Tax=Corticium candelabrum TaxID=121492 RepID=UPI002E267534|nr:DNA replication complex GINS protein SLD5-like [Corticium candelabrum]